ncbi:MAG: hypothetical protein KDJ39_06070 [Gammaproteobacteria bacterium]|nr:hypothetical protein [Gammaproteobacteria bacterium]
MFCEFQDLDRDPSDLMIAACKIVADGDFDPVFLRAGQQFLEWLVRSNAVRYELTIEDAALWDLVCGACDTDTDELEEAA